MNETINWIKSTDRLPDSEISVLAWCNGDVFMAWRDDETGWHDCASGGVCVVTWWADVVGPEDAA
jgi:hypothetical protein